MGQQHVKHSTPTLARISFVVMAKSDVTISVMVLVSFFVYIVNVYSIAPMRAQG